MVASTMYKKQYVLLELKLDFYYLLFLKIYKFRRNSEILDLVIFFSVKGLPHLPGLGHGQNEFMSFLLTADLVEIYILSLNQFFYISPEMQPQ